MHLYVILFALHAWTPLLIQRRLPAVCSPPALAITWYGVREQEAPYADGCSQIEILQTLKEHGGSGLLPTVTEDRAPLSEAFVGFVSDCLRVKPEVRGGATLMRLAACVCKVCFCARCVLREPIMQ